MRYKIVLILLILLLNINITFGDTITLRPNGVGTYSDYTPSPAVANYLNVDDVSNDGNSTYVYISVDRDTDYYFNDDYIYPPKDTYHMTDSPAKYGKITSITAYTYFATYLGSGSGLTSLKMMVGNDFIFNGIDFNHSIYGGTVPDTNFFLQNTYVPFSFYEKYTSNPMTGAIYANPITGNTFTWDEINTMEAGFSIGSLAGGANYIDGRVTQFYVIVTYDTTTPSRVINVINTTAMVGGTIYLNLSWDEGSINTDAYNVSVDGVWYNTTNTYANTTIPLNEEITAYIYAWNESNSKLSEVSTAVNRVTNAIPSTPTLITPINISLVKSTPVVLNVSSTDADNHTIIYYFYGGASPSSMTFLGNNDNVSMSSFNWSISDYGVYYWTAKAYDEYEYSSNMSTAQFTLLSPPNLTSPTNTSTAYTTYPPLTYDVTFTWENVGVPYYRIYISKDENFNIITEDKTISTTSTTESLIVNDEYFWKVLSYDGTTYSNDSDIFRFNLTGNSTLTGAAIEGVVYKNNDGYTPISGAEISIWNATWSDSAVTGSNGYYVFAGLTVGEVYSLQAKADKYLTSSVAIITAGSVPTTKNFYLLDDLTATEWWHYVKFTVWGFAGYYADVPVVVYQGDSVTAYASGTTGTDGSATFHLNQNVKYRITFIDATQGINKELNIYPVDNSYLVFIAWANPWEEYSTPINEAIDIDVTTEIINSTHAYVNVTYTDTLQQTTAATVYLNQTNNSDPYNQTVIGSQTAGLVNNWTHSFVVSNYQGESYYIHVLATHTTYGTIDKTYAVSFIDNIIFDGIPSKFFLYLALFIMVFTAGMFGATSVQQGSMIVVAEGWVFLFFGWFNSIDSALITVGLGFATVFAILANINAKTKKEGIE